MSHGTAASSATVEVAGYRPIFILGDVQNPGPYPFRPGLRMVQALALAGGVYRLQDLGMLRLSRDAISAAGEIQVLETRQVELIVKRARLEAELSDAAALSLPDEIAQSARGAEAARPVMERQQALFTVRREAFLKQVATMTRLIRSLRAEVGSLDRQNALKARQIDTVEQELTSARALVAQGLAPLARGLELERLAADIESDRREVATHKLQARQAIARTEQSLLSLSDDRQSRRPPGSRISMRSCARPACRSRRRARCCAMRWPRRRWPGCWRRRRCRSAMRWSVSRARRPIVPRPPRRMRSRGM